MYQVKRNNRVTETLQLCNPDGSVADEIEVDLNIDIMSARLNKAYEMVGIAQTDLEQNMDSPQLMVAYGKAVLAFFEVIFGEIGKNKLVNFYDGNYTEMLLDIFPFINDVVMPKVKEASEQRKAQLLALAQKG